MFSVVICFFPVLQVAVKCRPLTEREQDREIVRVNENKVTSLLYLSFFFAVLFLESLLKQLKFIGLQEVIVLDPDLSKDYLDRVQNRTKERKYCFDHAFSPESTNLVRFLVFYFLFRSCF